MVSSIDNVHVGSCLITAGSTDLGWLDENGFTLEMPGHKFVIIKADEFGVYPIGKIDVGIESLKIKFNLIENTAANRVLLMPLSSDGGANKRTEGIAPGTEMTSSHYAVNVHPRRLLTANKTLDLDIHLCLLEWKGEYAQSVEGVQMLVVEGEAIVKTGNTEGNRFFSFGGAAS